MFTLRWLPVFVLLSSLAAPLAAQQPSSHTLTFGTDARLTTPYLPACLHQGTLLIDKSKINVPASTFTDSLLNLYKRLNVPTPAVPPSDQRDLLLFQVKTTIDSSLSSLKIAIEARQKARKPVVLQYDATYPFLPVQLANTDTLIEVRSPTYPGGIPGLTPAQASLDLSQARDSITYTIVRREPDNAILANHLARTDTLYKGIPASYKALFQKAGTLYRRRGAVIDERLFQDTLTTLPSASQPYNSLVVDSLAALTPSPEQLLQLEKQILMTNERWIKSWLWYTGGQVRLNPFVVFNPAPVLREVETQLRVHTEQLKSAQNPGGFTRTNDDEQAWLVRQIRTLELQKETLLPLPNTYAAWIARRSVSEKPLYAGVWHLSSANTIRWLHHTDAAQQFVSRTEINQLPDMVALRDDVYAYSHNVKAGDNVSLKASRADFTPQTKVALSLDEITSQFSLAENTLGLGLAAIVGNLLPPVAKTPVTESMVALYGVYLKGGNLKQDAWQFPDSEEAEITQQVKTQQKATGVLLTLANKDAFLNALNRQLSVLPPTDMVAQTTILTLIRRLEGLSNARLLRVIYAASDGKSPDVAGYYALVRQYRESQTALNWLLSQTEPVLSLKTQADNVPAYRTVTNLMEQKLTVDKSSTVTYQLFKNDAKEPNAEGSYKKYKQVRVLPLVGVAYVPQNRTATVFDEATSQFKTGTTFSNVEALIGVKWYAPFPYSIKKKKVLFLEKTNPARDADTRNLIRDHVGLRANRLRGNSFWNTLFLTAGLGVSHDFLRNYYAGIGGDLVPGLSVHGGGNFIFRKYYQLDNGTILNQQERPAPFWYVSLSIDPAIAGSLVKLLVAGK